MLGRNVPHGPWNIPIFEYSRTLGRNVSHGPWNIPIFEYSRMSGRNVPHGPWNIPIFEYSRMSGRNVLTRGLKYSHIWIFSHVRKECSHKITKIFRYLNEYSRMAGRNVPTETLKYSDIWIVLQGKPLSIPLGPFRIFSKIRGEICHRCRWSVVHLDLRMSPRIFEKNWNSPNGILWGWGKLIHDKTTSKKISWHCPFKLCTQCEAGIFWEAEYQMLFSALLYYFYQQNE